jgi:nitrogen fixation NifU-like protein
VTAFRAIVLEHFRRPRNRGSLPGATVSVEGANPLCGDRIRVQLLADRDRIADARFTADACAICIAAASMLTEGARGLRVSETSSLDLAWLQASLEGEAPPGRKRCVTLPLDTFHRAVSTIGAGA